MENDVEDMTVGQLRHRARGKCRIRSGRSAGMVLASAHNFILALIREIERLRDPEAGTGRR